ncbi:hypothetical protein I2I11_04530 [Pontibacter sp. 172403-2]|uniref:hypothetical protein n=1 Tax=Pontibacter rufus TaxID=2791028 RepID=UPI0018AFD622|nr:hypothetical protein [Pontibacter sp. 172403-2]MBF9252551.1 hypothetical protein [Pontibacter sp. 172403-2]
MNKIKFLLIWCLAVGTLMSCGKEDDPEAAPGAELDYLPTTTGSTWTYGGISPYTLTVTGTTSVINGKTYHEMESKQGTSVNKSYVLKEKGVYTAVGMVPAVGSLEIAILKEETPVGEPWEQTTSINGIDTKMTLTIVEKNVSKTVEGKTYNNVINVKMETSYIFMGEDLGVGLTTHYYFSKGIGLILSDFGANGQVPLLTYNIK